MKRLIAVVISIAALGAFAAPASAEPPVFSATIACVTDGGPRSFTSIGFAGEAQQGAIAETVPLLKDLGIPCEPGTLEITVERFP